MEVEELRNFTADKAREARWTPQYPRTAAQEERVQEQLDRCLEAIWGAANEGRYVCEKQLVDGYCATAVCMSLRKMGYAAPFITETTIEIGWFPRDGVK